MDVQEFVEVITRPEYASNFRFFPYWGVKFTDLCPPWFEPAAEGAHLGSVEWSVLKPSLVLHSRAEGMVHLRPQTGESDPSTQPAHTWRHDKIWADGKPTVESMVVYCDFSLVLFLRSGGLRVQCLEDEANEGLHEIFLDGLTYESFRGPDEFDPQQLGRWALQLLRLQADNKVYSQFRKRINDTITPPPLSTPSGSFLLRLVENGIDADGLFVPPRQAVNEARKIAVSKGPTLRIKGLSQFPKVDEVLGRMGNKPQTMAGSFLIPAINESLAISSRQVGSDAQAAEFDNLIEATRQAMKVVEDKLRSFYYSTQLFGSRIVGVDPHSTDQVSVMIPSDLTDAVTESTDATSEPYNLVISYSSQELA